MLENSSYKLYYDRSDLIEICIGTDRHYYTLQNQKKRSVINAVISNSYNFYGIVTENLQKCMDRLERRAYKIV